MKLVVFDTVSGQQTEVSCGNRLRINSTTTESMSQTEETFHLYRHGKDRGINFENTLNNEGHSVKMIICILDVLVHSLFQGEVNISLKEKKT